MLKQFKKPKGKEKSMEVFPRILIFFFWVIFSYSLRIFSLVGYKVLYFDILLMGFNFVYSLSIFSLVGYIKVSYK